METGELRRAGAALAALAFLAWHGAAIALAPYPDSEVERGLRPLFEPYLRLAYLDHPWTFFGPRPDAGRLVRYEVVGRGGARRRFPLSEALDRASPAYFRWMRLYDRVAAGAPELREGAAALLCRRHQDLAPRGIRFVVLHQLTMSPELYRAGLRPGDPEAVWRESLPEIPCAPRPERQKAPR